MYKNDKKISVEPLVLNFENVKVGCTYVMKFMVRFNIRSLELGKTKQIFTAKVSIELPNDNNEIFINKITPKAEYSYEVEVGIHSRSPKQLNSFILIKHLETNSELKVQISACMYIYIYIFLQ